VVAATTTKFEMSVLTDTVESDVVDALIVQPGAVLAALKVTLKVNWPLGFKSCELGEIVA